MMARELATFCVYLASYYVAYRFGMSFSQATASPFWFPDSVLLCALLLTPIRLWWLIVLGTLPIRLVPPAEVQLPLWFLLDMFAIDSAKGVVTALALRRFLPDALRLQSVRDFAIYCFIAVSLVPAAAAILGAGARNLLGHDFWEAWRQWFLGDALTHLVITPAVLYGLPGAERSLRRASPARWAEGLLMTSGLIIAGYIAFQAAPGARDIAEPRFFAPIPFLFWAALRFGIPGASGAVAVISVISLSAALRGKGPFAGRSANDTALALQEFLLLRALPLYLVGILTEQKDAADERLARSEQRYREVVDTQAELLCRFLENGTLSFVSEAFCRAFQRDRRELLGTDFTSLMVPQAGEGVRVQINVALLSGRGEWECPVALPGGDVGWQHWVCHVVARTGAPRELQAIGRDISDRKRAEDADRRLSGKLIEAQEQERARIARDLHDDIIQQIASASIDLSSIRADGGLAEPGLDRLQARLIALSEDVRRISHNLHPSLLDHIGLSTALGQLCGAMRDAHGPSIALLVRSPTDDLSPNVALCLYRAAQEGLSNALRHAAASHIEMELRLVRGYAELSIKDDGVGVSASSREGRPRGLGLLSLEERVVFLGGQFDLTTGPGRGVCLNIRLPVRD